MSTLVASNLSDGTTSIPTNTVVNGSAKAWANLKGTGTIAGRDSLNISSYDDNGTGQYDFNFTSAFADTNFNTTENHVRDEASNWGIAQCHSRTTTSVTSWAINTSFGYADMAVACVTCQGDLA